MLLDRSWLLCASARRLGFRVQGWVYRDLGVYVGFRVYRVQGYRFQGLQGLQGYRDLGLLGLRGYGVYRVQAYIQGFRVQGLFIGLQGLQGIGIIGFKVSRDQGLQGLGFGVCQHHPPTAPYYSLGPAIDDHKAWGSGNTGPKPEC